MTFNREARALSHKVRQAGKGSAPRKAQDQEKYSEGYDRIFGKDKEKVKDKPKKEEK